MLIQDVTTDPEGLNQLIVAIVGLLTALAAYFGGKKRQRTVIHNDPGNTYRDPAKEKHL